MNFRLKAMYLFAFIFLYAYVNSEENDQFQFYSEDISDNQLTIIEVLLPDMRSKGILEEDILVIYTIKIGDDGIIRSIVSTNKQYTTIFRRENYLNIDSSQEKPFINNIMWDDGNVYVRGLVGTYYSASNSFTQIKVSPENNIIYDSPIFRLLQTSNNSLQRINKTQGPFAIYMNNTTGIYYQSGDISNKYIYYPSSREINVDYYGGIDGTIKYEPSIKIKTDNTKLHSDNKLLNVLNYLLLQSTSATLADVLFPLVFFENPFSSLGWVYMATSYLTEGSTIYTPNNLGIENGLPWASSNGNGIGDKILIDMGISPVNSIVIVNGFVSKEKPYLFLENSRAKQIKIKNLTNGITKNITLDDSAIAKNINLGELRIVKNTVLELEILSVYSGNKYQDLCIQSITPGSTKNDQ
jgi:hypothetical protein